MELNYRDLNRRANQLAHYLRALGVGPEVVVGVCMERSASAIVALLGTLKTGGAYLPLETTSPAGRLAYLMKDSRVGVVLTQSSICSALGNGTARLLCLDELRDVIETYPDTNPSCRPDPDNLAYVIYTSGSTGNPKGVAISYRGFQNYVSWAVRSYELAPGSRTPWFSPLAFDLTVTSIYPALVTGGCVEVMPPTFASDELAEALRIGNYCLLKLTPSHLRILNGLLPSVRSKKGPAKTFVIGGEALTYSDVRQWRQATDVKLVNEYGPTETVVGSSIYVVGDEQDAGSVPIGKPIANTQLYVLDTARRPAPVGIIGELYIGGVGVARGYLNRPALTAEKFVPDPFGTTPGMRLYRTGDRARWRRDGNLEFLGRADEQIKIRGHRVELGEIESVIQQHSDVRSVCVVLTNDSSGDEFLVAYVVADNALEISDLRAFLSPRLPAEMIPHYVVNVDAIPLTVNGKVDKKALPLPTAIDGVSRSKPDVLLESSLAAIWSEILRVPQDKFGIDHDFFVLGGNATAAEEVASLARNRLRVDFPATALFECTTIRALCARFAEGQLPMQPSPSAFEKHVERIWKEVLGAEDIDPDARFFDLGGTSILAAQVLARLKQLCPAVLLRDLFRYPTVRSLAKHLAGAGPREGQVGEGIRLVDARGELHQRRARQRAARAAVGLAKAPE